MDIYSELSVLIPRSSSLNFSQLDLIVIYSDNKQLLTESAYDKIVLMMASSWL